MFNIVTVRVRQVDINIYIFFTEENSKTLNVKCRQTKAMPWISVNTEVFIQKCGQNSSQK